MNKGFIIYSILLFGVLVAVIASYEQPKNWRKTYSRYDGNPYGSKALGELIDDVFPSSSVTKNNSTLYEIFTSENTFDNVLVISESFYPDEASLNALLDNVAAGQTAFISAQYYGWKFGDTLGVSFDYDRVTIGLPGDSADSTALRFGDDDEVQYVSSELLTSIDSFPENTEVMVFNDSDSPVMIRVPYGDGYFIINTTPILFTNFFLLYEDNHQYVSEMLSHLPDQHVTWTEYYSVGKLESQSPFREILTILSLRHALYLALGLIFLYIIFESKRAQRAIPVILPHPNQTLDFVKTVGALYFHSQEHKSAAVNKINYFRDFCRMQYGLVLHWDDPAPMIAKSGMDEGFIKELFELFKLLEQKAKNTADDLVLVNDQLNKFYGLTGLSRKSIEHE